MNCNETRESFSDLVDRTLPDADRAGVERHVEQCAACRAELDEFRRTIAAVAALPRRSAPRNFAAGVMARIRAEGAAAVPAAPATKRGVLLRMSRYQGLIQLVSGAAAVFLVYMGVSVFTGGSRTGPAGKPDSVAKEPAERLRSAVKTTDDSTKAGESWGRDEKKEKLNDALAGARQEQDGAPADLKKGQGVLEPGMNEAKDKNGPRPDAAAGGVAPVTAGPAEANVAFQHITVFSSDVAVDSTSVRKVLTDAGYNYTAAEKSNVLVVRVPARDATRLVAALGESGAEFRMGGRKAADEVARRQREMRKLTAGKEAPEEGDRNQVVAGARDLEKALRNLEDLDDSIEKAKTAKRGEEQKKQIAQGEGMRAGAGRPSDPQDGGPETKPGDSKHDQRREAGAATAPGGEESYGAAPGAPRNPPPADKPAPASDPAGKSPEREKDIDHNEEERAESPAGGGTGGSRRLKGDGDDGLELADDERDLAAKEKESEQKMEEALKRLEKTGAAEEECVFLVIEFEAVPEPAKQESK
ncbi:MAG: zf-HC2 domain-containing protein [Planctomycetes bacterium]|nr:zf-HC2 domain-containing protein [Planctomycetota bacterium]